MIFGGEAFVDLWVSPHLITPRGRETNGRRRIGEISLMRDLTKTMEIMKEVEEEEEAEKEAEDPKIHNTANGKAPVPTEGTGVPTAHGAATAPEIPPRPKSATAPAAEPTATPDTPPRPEASATRSKPPANQFLLTDRSDQDARLEAEMTERERELKGKEKKKSGLSKEQREELAAYEAERKRVRQDRVDTLTRKLIDRISIWTETDKGKDTTHAFNEKTKYEVENLKMESFGLDILHGKSKFHASADSYALIHCTTAIGSVYLMKGASFIKSQKFLGIGGFFSRLKDKGTLVKETWGTISTAIDAQMTMEEMAKLEEKGGDEWTDEKKAEYERKVTGKILAAAWRGSKFEIQSVLR